MLRPSGLLALWCYDLTEVTPAIDEVVRELYVDYLDAYREPERRLIENGYRSQMGRIDRVLDAASPGLSSRRLPGPLVVPIFGSAGDVGTGADENQEP